MSEVKKRARRGTLGAFALGIGLSACAQVALTQAAMAQAAINGPALTWDFSIYTPQTSSATAGFAAMTEAVNAQTSGKFNIKIHWGGTLAPVKETLDAMKLGAFQMGMVAQSFHPGKIPTTNIFDLPFLQFGNLKNQLNVMRAYFYLPEVVADAARWDAVILMPSILTPYELAGRGKAPTRVDDLKGLRLRAPGGMGEALKTVGVTPSNIASPEMYGALDRGLIDGLTLPFYAHYTYKTQELVNWYTTNMELGIVSAYAAINVSAWNGLPEAYRKLMVGLVDVSQDRGMPRILADNQKVLDEFKVRKIEPVTFSKTERDKLVEMGARPIWNKWVAEMNAAGYPGQKLLDFVLTESAKGM